MGTLTRTLMEDDVADILNRGDMSTSTEIQRRLQWAYDQIADRYDWAVLKDENQDLFVTNKVKTYAFPAEMRTVETVRWIDTTSLQAHTLEFKESDEFFDDAPYAEGHTNANPTQWTRLGNNLIVNPIPGTDQVSVVYGADLAEYDCILKHTSGDADDEPGVGAAEATYWTARSGAAAGDEKTWVTATDYDVTMFYLIGQKHATAFSADSSTTDLDKNLDEAIVYLAASKEFRVIDEDDAADKWQRLSNDIATEAWNGERALLAQQTY